MTFEEMLVAGQSYFENNEEDFIQAIEELDNWNGYLGDDRCYPMCELDDFFCGTTVSEFLKRIGENFTLNAEYFYFDVYGVESCDEKDYSDLLTKSFVEELYDYRNKLWLENNGIKEIFDEYDSQEEE